MTFIPLMWNGCIENKRLYYNRAEDKEILVNNPYEKDDKYFNRKIRTMLNQKQKDYWYKKFNSVTNDAEEKEFFKEIDSHFGKRKEEIEEYLETLLMIPNPPSKEMAEKMKGFKPTPTKK